MIPSGKGIAATAMYAPSPRNQNWELVLPYGTQFASGTDECLKAVREQASRGIKWVKLFADWGVPTFNYDEIKTIVSEVKEISYIRCCPRHNKGRHSHGDLKLELNRLNMEMLLMIP